MPTNNAIQMGVEEQVVHAALTVQENGGAVSMSAGGGVIKAVSPTVDLDRVAGGVQITVKDVRGSQSETVFDGPKGDKGDKGDPGNFSLDQLLVTDSASGAVASFADGGDDLPLKALTVGIAPVQDLHGQSAPYPPGGGKNLYPIAVGEDQYITNGNASYSNSNGSLVIVTDSSSNASGIYLKNTSAFRSVIDSNDAPMTVSMDIVASAQGNVRIVFCGSTSLLSIGTTKQRVSVSAEEKTQSNFNIYGVSNGATLTVSNLQIEKGSSATDYAPYTNICPISGHTGVNVSRTGVNVWDEQTELGTINSSGEDNPSTTTLRTVNYIPVLPGKTYYYKSTETAGFRFYDANKTFKSSATGTKNATFTVPSGCYYLRFVILSGYGTTYNHDISINYPSTDHDYHSGEDNVVIPITWETAAGTVYGGTLDVVNGVLTVDRRYMLLDDPDKWQTATGTTTIRYNTGASDRKVYSDSFTGVICSYAVVDTYAEKSARWGGANSTWFGFRGFDLTLEQVKSDASAGKIAILYELAEAVTYQLSAQQISSLLGMNNIWGDDGGDTNVTYYADTKLYIEKRLAELQALILEN